MPRQRLEPVERGPRILVDVNHTTGFAELGRLTVLGFTLNSLQTIALQLVYKFLDKYSANPDSAD